MPPVSSRRSAAEISRRKSDTVPPMADTSTNVALVVSAMTWAMDVLPVPAGPNRMTELSVSDSMALRSQLPSPTASPWPTTSSSERGRRRTASGATSMRRPVSTSVNNESVCMASCYHDIEQMYSVAEDVLRRALARSAATASEAAAHAASAAA